MVKLLDIGDDDDLLDSAAISLWLLKLNRTRPNPVS